MKCYEMLPFVAKRKCRGMFTFAHILVAALRGLALICFKRCTSAPVPPSPYDRRGLIENFAVLNPAISCQAGDLLLRDAGVGFGVSTTKTPFRVYVSTRAFVRGYILPPPADELSLLLNLMLYCLFQKGPDLVDRARD
jgi:hypothetical protein